MNDLKILIAYYSSTGTNYQLAQWAEQAVREEGAEIRLRKVAELAPPETIAKNPLWKKHAEATKHVQIASLDDLEWADAYIFSMPTRYGNVPAQMKQYLDSAGSLWMEGKLANKAVTAMASAQNPHGGQEETVLSLYTTMYHWGAIVVSPGYTSPVTFAAGGNPYGTTVSVDENGMMKEDVKEAVRHQAKRLFHVASWIRDGAQKSITEIADSRVV